MRTVHGLASGTVVIWTDHSGRLLPSEPDHPQRAAPLAANIPLHLGVGYLVRRPILRTTSCTGASLVCAHLPAALSWFGVLDRSDTVVSYAF